MDKHTGRGVTGGTGTRAARRPHTSVHAVMLRPAEQGTFTPKPGTALPPAATWSPICDYICLCGSVGGEQGRRMPSLRVEGPPQTPSALQTFLEPGLVLKMQRYHPHFPLQPRLVSPALCSHCPLPCPQHPVTVVNFACPGTINSRSSSGSPAGHGTYWVPGTLHACSL